MITRSSMLMTIANYPFNLQVGISSRARAVTECDGKRVSQILRGQIQVMLRVCVIMPRIWPISHSFPKSVSALLAKASPLRDLT